MRAAIYARISADKTGKEAGVDRQIRECTELAERLGWTVTATYVDNDLSAFSGVRRPRFEAMLADMERGQFEGLLAYHTDRLYRSPVDLEGLIEIAEKVGLKFETVNSGQIDLSTSAGRMVARILGSVSRQESEHHAERRRLANRERAIAGEWRKEGSRPFGYTKDGEPLEPEATMIRTAVTEILGGKSLHAVARDWQDTGVTTVRGAQWSNLHVRRVLQNAVIAGLRVHRGEIVGQGTWEAIVPESTWRGLVAFLSNPSRKNAVAFERRYLLSGVAICGTCEKPLYGAYPHGRSRPMVYVCKSGSHVGRNAADLDEYVELAVLAYLAEEGLGSAIRQSENRVDLAELRAERAALVESKDQLATLLRKRILDMAGVERESVILADQIAEIDRKLSDSVTVHPLVAILAEDNEDPATIDLDTLVDRWVRASMDRKGKAIKSLFEVKVNPTKQGQRKFDDQAVDLNWH